MHFLEQLYLGFRVWNFKPALYVYVLSNQYLSSRFRWQEKSGRIFGTLLVSICQKETLKIQTPQKTFLTASLHCYC